MIGLPSFGSCDRMGLSFIVFFVLVLMAGVTEIAKADPMQPIILNPDAAEIFLRLCPTNTCSPPDPPKPSFTRGIQAVISLGLSPTSTPGEYLVTGISGYYSDANAGFSGEITGLEPMGPSMVPASLPFSPPAATAAGFGYDNLIYPFGAPNVVTGLPSEFLHAPNLVDAYGLAFDVEGGYTVTLWGEGGDPATGAVYGVSDALGSDVLDDNVQLSVNVAPEPGSLLLLATGVFGVAGISRRRWWNDEQARR